MSKEFTRVFLRDDKETEVEVNFGIASFGCPSNGWDEPGEGPEIEIGTATLIGTDETVDLTDAESSRFHDEVSENIADYEDDGPDDDYLRDRRIDEALTGGEE